MTTEGLRQHVYVFVGAIDLLNRSCNSRVTAITSPHCDDASLASTLSSGIGIHL